MTISLEKYHRIIKKSSLLYSRNLSAVGRARARSSLTGGVMSGTRIYRRTTLPTRRRYIHYTLSVDEFVFTSGTTNMLFVLLRVSHLRHSLITCTFVLDRSIDRALLFSRAMPFSICCHVHFRSMLALIISCFNSFELFIGGRERKARGTSQITSKTKSVHNTHESLLPVRREHARADPPSFCCRGHI